MLLDRLKSLLYKLLGLLVSENKVELEGNLYAYITYIGPN